MGLGQGESLARWRVGLLAGLAVVVGLMFASHAEASLSFCLIGSGAGQCEKPEGVGVDTSEGAPSSGHLYVADRGNNRVDVFEANGEFVFAFGWGVADGATNALQVCTNTCFRGIAGSGAGQFSGLRGIAVDNDESSASFHDVYVFDGNNRRVEKFSPTGSFLLSFGSKGSGAGQFGPEVDPIEVGPGGTVYVGDTQGTEAEGLTSRVEKFTPGGSFIESVALPTADDIFALAVDSGENLYAVFNRAAFVHKYNPSGVLVASLDPTIFTVSIAVDSADHLFAAQTDHGFRAIGEYDASGNHVRRFGYGEIEANLRGIAPYSTAEGDVFGSEEFRGTSNRVLYLPFPPPGPIVAPPSVLASPVGNAKATLKAEVNPEGKATSYHFDYVDQKGFEEQGESFTGPHTKTTSATPLAGEGFTLQAASAQVGCANPLVEAAEGKCLTPSTTYHFRVVATNSEGTDEAAATFTTKPPLEAEIWSSAVATDVATLSAKVNPLGIPATGFFEYVPDAAFQESGFATAVRVPASGELEFGAGESPLTRSATISPLTPATTYRYRLIVDDPLIEPITTAAKTFTTFAKPLIEPCPANEAFRTGLSAALPDCRAYEMVTPLDKEGGDIVALDEPTNEGIRAALDQSSVSGEKLAYGSYRAFGDAKSAPYTSQYIARREAGVGWSSRGISPPRISLDVKFAVAASLDTDFKEFSPDLCEGWLRTLSDPPLSGSAVAEYPNLYRRSDEACGPLAYEAITTVKPPDAPPEEYFPLELQGTAGPAAAIYTANDNLVEGAPAQPAQCVAKESPFEKCQLRLYYKTPIGGSHFVCVLPNGEPSPGNCSAGTSTGGALITGQNRYANLVNAISADGSRVFWSASLAKGNAAPIFVRENPGELQSTISGGECTEPSRACTIAVSEEGEELSGTSASQFWAADPSGTKVVFTSGKNLYEFDTTARTTTLISHKVFGVAGASSDLLRIYFASEEVLTGANGEGKTPQAGRANLYLYQSGSGFRFAGELSMADVTTTGVAQSAVAVFPIRHTARVSSNGVGLAFASVGSPTGYENTDAVSGRADAEVYLYDAEASGGEGRLVCVSCNPSGGRPSGRSRIPGWETTLYASRVLSEDDNRVFFESYDSLSARDSNGVADVYQWEAAGTGGCEQTDPDYFAANGGCVSLISSGQSARGDEFIDASPDGHDVFFATAASLLPQDYGLVDIYDARAGGGLPIPPAPAAGCEGESCQHPAAAPAYGTPSSSVYEGPEDLANVAPKKRICPKGKVRRAGHCVKKAGKTHRGGHTKHRSVYKGPRR